MTGLARKLAEAFYLSLVPCGAKTVLPTAIGMAKRLTADGLKTAVPFVPKEDLVQGTLKNG